MKLREARKVASNLMRKHELTSMGWALRFNTRRHPLGIAFEHGRKKWIGLSLSFVLSNPPHKVEEIVKHEIAHVLRGVKYGHDKLWKAIARSIGASGNQTYDEPILRTRVIGRWICDSCGNYSEISRKPKRSVRYACRRCLQKHGYTRTNELRFKMKLVYYTGGRLCLP